MSPPFRSGSLRAGPLLAGALAIALIGSACTDNRQRADDVEPQEERANINEVTSDEAGEPGGRIAYALEAESDGWNPTVSRWAASGLIVARAMFDTVTAYDDDLGIHPNLAESLEPNDDNTVWTITLREGVTFHNGSPVTGEAYSRVLNFFNDSPLTGDIFELIDTIEATGPLEVTVTMTDPWANFPYALATQIGVVPDPDWLESGDTRTPVGTGPFVMSEWVPNGRLVVTKNPSWWRPGFPLLDEVEFSPVIDEASRTTQLVTGEVDIIIQSNGDQIAQISEDARDGQPLQVIADPNGETAEVFAMLNTLAPPFDDPAARRALALATDRESAVAVLGSGQYDPADGPFAESSPWYVDTDYPDYDDAAARAAVEQVKTANGGTFAFTLLTTPSPSNNRAAQLLQSQWQAVGIDATIETTESASMIAQVITGDYQSVLWQQFDSPHPLGDSVWWHPNTANPIPEISLNFARNENEAIGAALDEARGTNDVERERELYGTVQTELAKDIPYVWLYHSKLAVAADTDLVNVVNYTLPDGAKGIELQGGSHPLWQVWRKK
jgi:ABC-type transport system substrate-binding protein